MSPATHTSLDQGQGVDASAGVPTVPSASAVSGHGHVEVDNVNGTPIKLYYERVGNGSNKVLFITGVHTAGAALEDQLAYFSNKPEYQCLLFDHRTVGRSTGSPRAAVSLQQYTNDVKLLLQNVVWHPSDTHIVGFGSGGLVALELAYHFDKLRSLTLVNASGAGKMLPLEGVKWYAQLKLAKDERKRVKLLSRLLYSKKWLRLPAVPVNHERKTNLDVACEKIARYHHIGAPEDQHLEEQKTAKIDRHRVSKHTLESIRRKNFPMLLICGTRDRLVHPGNSKYLARILQCTLESFAGSGHALASECPQRLNELLEHHFRTSGATITTGLQVTTSPTATTKDSVAIEPLPQRNTTDDRNSSVDAEDVVRSLDIKGNATRSSQILSEHCSMGTDIEEIDTAEPVIADSDWEDSSSKKTFSAAGSLVDSRIADLPLQPGVNGAGTTGSSDDAKRELGFSLAPAMRDVFAPLELRSEHDEALVSGLRKPESLGTPESPNGAHPLFEDTLAERHPEEPTVVPQSTMPFQTSGISMPKVEATADLTATQVLSQVVPIVATVTAASNQTGSISSAAPTELIKETTEGISYQIADSPNVNGSPVSVPTHDQISKLLNFSGGPEMADWNRSPLVGNSVVVTTFTKNSGAESNAECPVMVSDANGISSIPGQIGNWQLNPALEEDTKTVTQELALEEHMTADDGVKLLNRREATMSEAINKVAGVTNAAQPASSNEESPTIDDALTAGSIEFMMKSMTMNESGTRTSDMARANDMKCEESDIRSKDVELLCTAVPQADYEGKSITDSICGAVGKAGENEIEARAVADVGHGFVDEVGDVMHKIKEKVEVKDEVVSEVGVITEISCQMETLIPDRSIAAGEQPKQKNWKVADGEEKNLANKVHSILDDLSAKAYAKSASVIRNAEEVLGEESHDDVPSRGDEYYSYSDEDELGGTFFPEGAVRGVDQDAEIAYLAEGVIPGAFDDAEEKLQLQYQDTVDTEELAGTKLQSNSYGVPANGDAKPAPKMTDGRNVYEQENRQGVPTNSDRDRYNQGEHGDVVSPLGAMCGVRQNLECDDHAERMIPGAFDDVVEQPELQGQNSRETDEKGVAIKVHSLLDDLSGTTNAKAVPKTKDAGNVLMNERSDIVLPSIDECRQGVDHEEHGGVLPPLRAIRDAVGDVVGHMGDGFSAVTEKTRGAATSLRNTFSSHSTNDDTGRAFANGEHPSLEDLAFPAMASTPQPDDERGFKPSAPTTFRFELSEEEAREVLRKAREEVVCAPLMHTSSADNKTVPALVGASLKAKGDDGHTIGEKVVEPKAAVAGTVEGVKEAITDALSEVTSVVAPFMPKMAASRPSNSAEEPVAGAQPENTAETTENILTSGASASTYR